jgi:hypothetical protein
LWNYIYASIGFIVANVGYNYFVAKYHFSTSEFFGFVTKYLQRFEIVNGTYGMLRTKEMLVKF